MRLYPTSLLSRQFAIFNQLLSTIFSVSDPAYVRLVPYLLSSEKTLL